MRSRSSFSGALPEELYFSHLHLLEIQNKGKNIYPESVFIAFYEEADNKSRQRTLQYEIYKQA
jgi:hypothetical protein